MRAVARHLLQSSSSENPLLLVAFQEVMSPMDDILFPILQPQYRIIQQPNVPYGCALAIHRSCSILDQGFVPFSTTCMGRGILFCRVQLPFSNQNVLWTTTHLESYTGPQYNGSSQRQAQAWEMEEFCCAPRFARDIQMITGDLNWDDERVKSTGTEPKLLDHLHQSDWQDAWLETTAKSSSKSKAVGYTYDAKLNPMLGGNLRRRFDRILWRSGTNKYVSTKGVQFLGTEALPGLSWQKTTSFGGNVRTRTVQVAPSDHFGVVANLLVKEN